MSVSRISVSYVESLGTLSNSVTKMFEGVDDETERPFGSSLRAPGHRPTTTVGNPWLITNTPRRLETKTSCPTWRWR